MYSLSTCPWCSKAKRYFEEQGVAFEFTDYDRADGETQQRIDRDMREIEAGGFPVVKIGRNVVTGYQPDKYKELLAFEDVQ
jgi:glutaredoxin